MKKVFLTGSSGFVGKSLIKRLLEEKDFYVYAGGKREPEINSQFLKYFYFDENTSNLEIDQILEGVTHVFHLANKAHILNRISLEEKQNILSSNLNLTIKLAKQSIKSGVKKFIYVSSIKVNGTFSSSPFSYLDSPNPKDVYANNKLEIENKLIDLVRDSKMDLIIVRPPLVYGAGAKGNFRNLKKLVDLNLPLPFANLNNKRSFISIQNLCSFLFYCLDMNTKNQIFLVSDNEDISVKDFIKKISYSRNKKIKLFSFPIFLLKHIFKVLYGEDSSNSFFNSLQIKCSETIDLTGWNPKYSVEESLELD